MEAQSTRSRRGPVLFVDDEPLARRTFGRMLASRGFSVDVACGAADALTMAAQKAYAVVVTDLHMPDVGGLELIEQLRGRLPNAAFILVTGAGELNLPTVSASAGTISCIVRKPSDGDEMEQALVRALALHETRTGTTEIQVDPSLKTREILLIEDNPGDAEIVRRLLERGGVDAYALTTATRLSDGLLALEQKSFQLVLVDLSLPDARGIDSVTRLHAHSPATPIIVMSGHSDEELAVQAVKLGAQDYLVKGHADGQTLRRAIRYSIERKATEERLARLAHYDQLTGLANRTLFRESAVRSLRRAKRRGTHPAVLVLDLDRFKNINDTLGHLAGDVLLAKIAERLIGAVRDTDLVARMGGDEFAILIDDVAREEEHWHPAQRIIDALRPAVFLNEHEIAATTSIGIAVYPESGENIDELLGNADLAMYRAKEAGRNRYQFFDKALHERVRLRMELERDLLGALERGEFAVQYQPQTRLDGGRTVCMEALIRWNHPTLGLIGPSNFIPLLEELGQIVPVGEWVLRHSCAQIREWQDRFDAELRIAVNVSARQFDDLDFVAKVARAVRAAGIAPECVELEITEGLLLSDLDAATKVLRRLKDLGVRIAIDDFGTGYSRLAYLARFPIDVLKIDRSVIETIGQSEGDKIATAVIELGHTLGFEVIAEGVEEREQLDFLREKDCDIFQGFLSARPLDAGDGERWLRACNVGPRSVAQLA